MLASAMHAGRPRASLPTWPPHNYSRHDLRLREQPPDLRNTTAAVGASTEPSGDPVGRAIAGDGGLGNTLRPHLKANANDWTFLRGALNRAAGQQGAAFPSRDLAAIELGFQPFRGR